MSEFTEQVTTGELLAGLTDKQRRAIEVADYSDYFQRPREHNATGIAEKVDVCRQTLAQHLRAGQRKLLASPSQLATIDTSPAGRLLD